MLPRLCIVLLLLGAAMACCQVEPAASGDSPAPEENNHMRTPPPVSTDPYPVTTLYEARSNYLRAQFGFDPTYVDHVLSSSPAAVRADYIYRLWTNLEMDSQTGRGHQRFTYHPGITVYQNTSPLNDISHDLHYELKYLLTEEVQLSLRSDLQRSSNAFNDAFSPGQGVTGSAPYPTDGVIAPYASRRNLTESAQMTYQYSSRSMLGASGNFSNMDYLDPKQAQGLCGSSSRGGSAFYNHRLSALQYLGGTYQYMDAVSCPNSQDFSTLTHTIYFYYTKYFPGGLTLSGAGGPQHYDMKMPIFPSTGSWEPFLSASAGWQRFRSTFAASYSRTVEGGGGLIGSFHVNHADGSFARQLAKQWRFQAAANYQLHKTVNSLFGSGSNGHTVGASFTLSRRLGEHFKADFGYQHLHQSYGHISAVTATPDINRGYVSLSYDFSIPLGR